MDTWVSFLSQCSLMPFSPFGCAFCRVPSPPLSKGTPLQPQNDAPHWSTSCSGSRRLRGRIRRGHEKDLRRKFGTNLQTWGREIWSFFKPFVHLFVPAMVYLCWLIINNDHNATHRYVYSQMLDMYCMLYIYTHMFTYVALCWKTHSCINMYIFINIYICIVCIGICIVVAPANPRSVALCLTSATVPIQFVALARTTHIQY